MRPVRASKQAASTRASPAMGFGAPPPTTPECASTSAVRSFRVSAWNPRRPTSIDGCSAETQSVSETSTARTSPMAERCSRSMS